MGRRSDPDQKREDRGGGMRGEKRRGAAGGESNERHLGLGF